jgi:hypothetical protein
LILEMSVEHKYQLFFFKFKEEYFHFKWLFMKYIV